MSLEAVVFAQQDMFIQSTKDLYSSMIGGTWGYDLVGNELAEGNMKEEVAGAGGAGDGVVGESTAAGLPESSSYSWDHPSCSSLVRNLEEWDVNSSAPEAGTAKGEDQVLPSAGSLGAGSAAADAAGRRKKRRRSKSCKNKDEVESQRMTHIAVERNRRKQMNEYLAVLRSLMPPSYLQRGDQASIIGGAINFVKELEQRLQSLEAQKQQPSEATTETATTTTAPFSGFFTFPQHSACSAESSRSADIEVTMVESHASLRVLSRRVPKQLLGMVAGLQNLRLTTLHLNVVTTVDQMVLCSFSVKVENDCRLTSVDEIAAAVYQMLGRIQERLEF